MKQPSRIMKLVAFVLSVLLLSGCQSQSSPSPTPIDAAVAPGGPVLAEKGNLSALGTIRPAQRLQLGFGAGGPVRTMMVRLGTEVKRDELLAQLDTAALELELQSAQQEVALRQAQLDSLLNGPNATLVARAEAEHTHQVAQAEIALQVAQWQLGQARLQEQADFRDHALAIATIEAKLEQLDLQLAQARVQPPEAGVVAAQVGLARAQEALETAQTEYQKALDRYWEPQDVRDACAKAVWLAEQEVELAQARLDSASNAQRAHALDLEVQRVQREATETQLAHTLDSQVAYTATLALLEAEVDLAQLQLDRLQTWENPHLDPVPPQEIAQSRARLRQAELAVTRLELQLQAADLVAPFDGAISAVYLQPSEWAAPGIPAVELLDTAHWYVETRNVGELTIGRVQVGQKARVQVLAFQDTTLDGRVEAISPVAIVQQGDTTYTLMIALEPTDLDLRPGMNARVELLTEAD